MLFVYHQCTKATKWMLPQKRSRQPDLGVKRDKQDLRHDLRVPRDLTLTFKPTLIPNPEKKPLLEHQGLNLPSAPLVSPLKVLKDYSGLKWALLKKVEAIAVPSQAMDEIVPTTTLDAEVNDLVYCREQLKAKVEQLRQTLVEKRIATNSLTQKLQIQRDKVNALEVDESELEELQTQLASLRESTKAIYDDLYTKAVKELDDLLEELRLFRFEELKKEVEHLQEKKTSLKKLVETEKASMKVETETVEKEADREYLENVQTPFNIKLKALNLKLVERKLELSTKQTSLLELEAKLRAGYDRNTQLKQQIQEISSLGAGFDSTKLALLQDDIVLENEKQTVDADQGKLHTRLEEVQSRHQKLIDQIGPSREQLLWLEYQIGEYLQCVRVVVVGALEEMRAITKNSRKYRVSQVVAKLEAGVIQHVVKAAITSTLTIAIYAGGTVAPLVREILQGHTLEQLSCSWHGHAAERLHIDGSGDIYIVKGLNLAIPGVVMVLATVDETTPDADLVKLSNLTSTKLIKEG